MSRFLYPCPNRSGCRGTRSSAPICSGKPDPETYLGAAALFGCAPGEVIMVASHPSDLSEAARCDLRTCYVSRRLEDGEGRVVRPEPAARAEAAASATGPSGCERARRDCDPDDAARNQGQEPRGAQSGGGGLGSRARQVVSRRCAGTPASASEETGPSRLRRHGAPVLLPNRAKIRPVPFRRNAHPIVEEFYGVDCYYRQLCHCRSLGQQATGPVIWQKTGHNRATAHLYSFRLAENSRSCMSRVPRSTAASGETHAKPASWWRPQVNCRLA